MMRSMLLEWELHDMTDFRKQEQKIRKFWDKQEGLYGAKDNSKKSKKYVLVEFPYPSGSGLHVGHAFSFTGADVYARFCRMKGYNTLFPMGWDAFGLPTENYAIKTKQQPQKVTDENVATFKKQMKRLAFSFDWNREVNTTDPDYYKWTQWIFIKLFERGLAYKKEMPINWCPSCKIGLANEEVVDGKCERCGAEVSRRNISQWIVKITDYADRLLEGLEKTDFVEKVKKAQINWIGKSEGAKIKFKVVGVGAHHDAPRAIRESPLQELEVFTTRPDTLPGATFMVVAPEHIIVQEILNSKSEILNKIQISNDQISKIKEYVRKARGKSEMERTELAKEKTGVFSGLYAINPVNNKKIPIWISDFVLASYGTGAIMAVPAHDERDHAFAKKFGLPIIPVIERVGAHHDAPRAIRESPLPNTDVNNGVMINSDFLNGLEPKVAIKKMIDWLVEKGIGKAASSYHLRDWIFSRQHYWGEPIPMVNCPKCGWVPVDEKDLPIKLPEVEAYEPTETGESPLAKMTDWVKTACPKCGGLASRETDTMPNWAGSDWYFLRYCDPDDDIELASQEKMKYWMPVDVYVGGDEHNTLHLLYSRFIVNFLYDLGVVPVAEPYYKRLSHGVILGSDNQRMSKSKGNVVLPDVVADKYGVDVVRCYLMFMGPFTGTMAWNEKTLMGVKRFLEKWEKFVISQTNREVASSDEVKLIVNKTVEGVSRDIENFSFNTAIAKQMEMINDLSSLRDNKSKQSQGDRHVADAPRDDEIVGKEELEKIIKMLSPFAPYLTERVWSKKESVHRSQWPEVEKKYLVEDKMILPVAINGKKRAEIEIETGVGQDEVLKIARNNEKIKGWIEGKEVVREVYVSGKMINLVVK